MYRIYATRTDTSIGIQLFFKNLSSNEDRIVTISSEIFNKIAELDITFMYALQMLVICRDKLGIYNINDNLDSNILECFKDLKINKAFLDSLEKVPTTLLKNIIYKNYIV